MILAMARPTLTPAELWFKSFAVPSTSNGCLGADRRRLTQIGVAVGVSGGGHPSPLIVTGTMDEAA